MSPILDDWLKEVLPKSTSYPSGVSIPELFPAHLISLYSVIHNQESIQTIIKESGHNDWNPYNLIRGMPISPIPSGTISDPLGQHLARLIQQANPTSREVGWAILN